MKDDQDEDEQPTPRPETWPAFEQAVRERHGVADAALATELGVTRSRFHRRTARESWTVAREGVRLHPHVPDSVQQRVTVVTVSTAGLAAASRDTAAWLHGLEARPPDRQSVALAHPYRAERHRDVRIHRARWLTSDDVVAVQGVATLTVPATLLSSSRADATRQRARLIDVLHRGLATTDEVLALLDRVGPVPGKGTLRDLCHEFGPLTVESIFQDEVARTLSGLGYPAERSTTRIDTPDGVGLTPDIALRPWKVAVETEGDAFHRTRSQRRTDRRRIAAYAGTPWVPYPIDWRDWFDDRDHVLDGLDAAIASQRELGTGRDHLPPRRQ
ncbi:MAG: hypothetical protein WEB03_10670 [Nitriliruptor sp.]|uniref:hypothetical protein n=1 Tax=Nitriliruptor sp. TaxID=2448056 RepID=UPI0034A07AAD